MSTPFAPGASGRRVDLDKLWKRVREQVAQAGDRAFASPPIGDRRPPRVVTDVERKGVSPTDADAHSPLGVGTSMGARAEKIARRAEEPRRRRHGVEAPSRRPYGTSAPEHVTGVGAQGTAHEESPYIQPGD